MVGPQISELAQINIEQFLDRILGSLELGVGVCFGYAFSGVRLSCVKCYVYSGTSIHCWTWPEVYKRRWKRRFEPQINADEHRLLRRGMEFKYNIEFDMVGLMGRWNGGTGYWGMC